MTDYKKAWEDSVKYAHELELRIQELEKTEVHFAAELKAAKNDYARYKELKAELEALHILRDVVDWSIKPHREHYQEGTMKCELCEAWDKYSGKIALLTGGG